MFEELELEFKILCGLKLIIPGIINECEERLYTTTDASNSQQSAINSLIGERNYLLKQLDSLQTTIIQSNNSSKRLIELEREHQRLKSLINILSTEIE